MIHKTDLVVGRVIIAEMVIFRRGNLVKTKRRLQVKSNIGMWTMFAIQRKGRYARYHDEQRGVRELHQIRVGKDYFVAVDINQLNTGWIRNNSGTTEGAIEMIKFKFLNP